MHTPNTSRYFTHADPQTLADIGVTPDNIIELPQEELSELTLAYLTSDQCKQLIPEGNYCYTRVDGKFKICPFWDSFPQFPSQDNGYCHYMNKGDWQDKGIGLLWDQCKECGVKEYRADYTE